MKFVTKISIIAILGFLGLTGCQNGSDDGSDDSSSTSQTVKQKVSSDLSVVVLGSGGPVATQTGRASAGYLILTDQKPRILMDLGGGSFQRLAATGYDLKDLDIILLSHLHIDHTADLSATLKTIYFHNTRAINAANAAGTTPPPQRTAPVRIWGPSNANSGAFPNNDTVKQYPATTEYLDGHYALPGGVERYLNVFATAIGAGTFAYTGVDIDPDFTTYNEQTLLNEPDGLVVKAVGVNHGPVPAVAYRIEYKGKVVVYSGDTSSSGTNMENIADNADLLIYDTAIMDADFPPNPVFYKLHTKPTRIGEVAKIANVKKLVLSHITPATDSRQDEVKALVAANYTGPVEVAEDLEVFNVQ